MSVNVVQQSNLKEVSGTRNIKTVSVNGTNVPPDANKNVNISVPTKTSELTNDSQFQTKANFDSIIGDLQYAPQNYAQNMTDLVNKSFQVRGLGTNGGPPKIGDAAWRGVATDVVSGNTSLVTSGDVYTALQNAGGASVENGTWSPNLVLSGGYLMGSGAYYWKIGKMVILDASFFDSSSGAAGNGVIQKIQQLPFKTWYQGVNPPVPPVAGQILVVDNIKNVIGNNNTYSILVKQNITEINMIENDSVQLPVSNKSYRMFGYYLTD